MSLWTLGLVAHRLHLPVLAKPLASDQRVSSISTDSRTLEPGSVFVPLVGDRFDGHDYIEKALARGAVGVVWGRPEVPPSLLQSGVAVFQVPDTTLAYQALGLAHRLACQTRCVAITGSVGKTTTKEFLAHLLSSQMFVHRSEQNFNNDIGVPLTLLGLKPEHDVVIVEMGMRGPGQIARLVQAALPEVGLVTGIGSSHLELLGTREAIALAKSELVSGLPKDGRAILPAGDDFFSLLKSRSSAPVSSFGVDTGDLHPLEILEADAWGTTFRLGAGIHRLNLGGLHHLHDLMGALAAGLALGVDLEAMLMTLPSLEHPEGRAEWIELHGAQVYLDAYNAAPESMRAALSVLSGCKARKVAVLGDMLELGPTALQAHRSLGEELASFGIDRLLGYGPLTREMVLAAKDLGVAAEHFSMKDDLSLALEEELHPGVAILVKASRGMALETVIKPLAKETLR